MSTIITRSTPRAEWPEFFTVPEAATVLSVGNGLVYSLVRSGQLQGCRFGRLLRIPRASIERLLERQA